MIQSMTGYGKAEAVLEKGKITIEIRTLNGKNADVNIKTSLLPRDKELSVRQKIAAELHRGTLDFFMNFEPNAASSAKTIDEKLVSAYYSQLTSLRSSLGGFAMGNTQVTDRMNNDLLCAILRFPDVADFNSKPEVITEENWPLVEAAIDQALRAVNEYRTREGAVLYKDVTRGIDAILKLEDEVESFEKERIETVKAKILKTLGELSLKYDEARFEQEMVYYLEKLDINEERVRLRQHCAYFMDTINSEPFPGKKLGFILQEMGREINTTGSKANHAGIQKAVVRMKDELEKVREQSMNIL